MVALRDKKLKALVTHVAVKDTGLRIAQMPLAHEEVLCQGPETIPGAVHPVLDRTTETWQV